MPLSWKAISAMDPVRMAAYWIGPVYIQFPRICEMASMMEYTVSPKYAIQSGIWTCSKKYFLKRRYFCTFLFEGG